MKKKDKPREGEKVIRIKSPTSDTHYVSPVRLKHPLMVYQLAKLGTKPTRMASELGISKVTLKAWIDSVPEIKEAYDRGRAEATGENAETFKDYVAKNLPPDLAQVWKELEAAHEVDDSGEMIKTVLARHSLVKRQRQYLFMHALLASNFSLIEACRKTNTPQSTVKEWREDPKFEALAKQMHALRKDFVEDALMGLVRQADTQAVIFANKTLNSDRGYNPKTVVEHTGNVDHVHTTMDQLIAMLPLKMQREALKAIRSKKPAMLPVHQDVEVDPEPAEEIEDAEIVERGDE